MDWHLVFWVLILTLSIFGTSAPVKIVRFESIMQHSPSQHIMAIAITTPICVTEKTWIILYF